MNRKELYKMIRLNKKISLTKRAILVFFTFSFVLFSSSLLSVGTFSYFNAEYTATMQIKNAVKDDLVIINEGPLIFPEKCKAVKDISVKNIFDYIVEITIEGSPYVLQPGDEITHTIIVADDCGDFGEKTFLIIGYNHYFSHPVHVNVNKEELNPCPPASDNGQGNPNDNGNGKKCGHKDNELEDANKDTTEEENSEGNNGSSLPNSGEEQKVEVDKGVIQEQTPSEKSDEQNSELESVIKEETVLPETTTKEETQKSELLETHKEQKE